MLKLNRFHTAAALSMALGLFAGSPVLAQTPPAATAAAPAPLPASTGAPDAFVKALSTDILDAIRNDKTLAAGDINKVVALVDSKVLPNVNFQRMTASAVGRNWRQATPDQRKRLQEEFKNLLVYTYAGAVSQIRDQSVEVKPVRARPEDKDVVVRTLVRGKGEPIQIDYRLEKAGDTWKIYDVNVLGAWLVQTFQNTFAQEVTASGIDGLINKLAERNKQLAARKG